MAWSPPVPARPAGWKSVIAGLKQSQNDDSASNYKQLSGAIESLLQLNSTADMAYGDLAFLLQRLQACRDGSIHQAEALASRLVAACVLGPSNSRPAGSEATIITAALRAWADPSELLLHSQGSTTSAKAAVPDANGADGIGLAATASAAAARALGTTSPSVPAAATQQGQTGQVQGQSPGLSAKQSASALQHAALSAMAPVVQELWKLVAQHEQAATLVLLLSLVNPSSSQRPPSSPRFSQPPANHSNLVVQQLTVQVLSALCTRTANSQPLLQADSMPEVLQAVLGGLQSLCSGGARIEEDKQHSELYAALIKLLSVVLGEVKKGWTAHAAALVECLRKFFLYGVPAEGQAPGLNTTPSNSKDSSSPSDVKDKAQLPAPARGSTAYCPPHLRAARARRGEGSTDGGASTSGWSDSDMSDSESISGAGSTSGAAPHDRYKSSRVRLGVLSCLQAMAKADSRALQPYWTTLLPVQQPLQRRPLSPHLITILLYDPQPKVRNLAAATIAALLEGSASRGYMAVAAARTTAAAAPRAPPVRGFITLSTSLGHLAVCVHAGLLHAVAAEPSILVLSSVLRALCIFTGTAPLERLPQQLLPDMLIAVRARWESLASSTNSNSPATQVAPRQWQTETVAAVQPAYLACIAEALSTKQPLAGLQAYLLTDTGSQQQQQRQQQGARSMTPAPPTVQLVQELLAAAVHQQAAVRIEALAALNGLASNYIEALPEMWERILEVAQVNMAVGGQPQASTKDGSPAPLTGVSHSIWKHTEASTGGAADQATAWRSASASAAQQQSSSKHTAFSPPSFSLLPAGPADTGGTTADDKARQLAVKLVCAYITSCSKVIGLGPDPALQMSDDAPVPALPPASATAAAGAPPGASIAGAGEQGRGSTAGEGLLGGSQGLATAAIASQLAGWWESALGLLIPGATSSPTFMVRTAALNGLSDISHPLFCLLPTSWQSKCAELAALIATTDPAAAVRAASCKAMGSLAACQAVMQQQPLCACLQRAVIAALQDSVLSVRIAASWALCILCDTMGQMAAQQVHAQHAPAASSHADAAEPNGTGLSSVPPSYHLQQLPALYSCATGVAQAGADKVRAFGIRAVGCLLSHLTPPVLHLTQQLSISHQQQGNQEVLPADAWLDTALSCIQACLATGSMRVQLGACATATALFTNAQLLPLVQGRVVPLLLLLTMLVRDCANYKVRMCAAAALGAVPTRAGYGHVLMDSLLVVCGALESVDATTSSTSSSNTMGSTNASTGGASADSHKHADGSSGSSTAATQKQQQQGAEASEEAGGRNEEDGSHNFPNFRYVAGLAAQLRTTLLHLLALVQPGDAARARDALRRKVSVLLQVVEEAAATGVQQVTRSLPAQLRSVQLEGDTASRDPALLLPADPFHASSTPTSPNSSTSPPVPPLVASDTQSGSATGSGWQQAVQEACSVLGLCAGANKLRTAESQACLLWAADASASRAALAKVTAALAGVAVLMTGPGATQEAGCAGQMQELQHGLQQVSDKLEQLSI